MIGFNSPLIDFVFKDMSSIWYLQSMLFSFVHNKALLAVVLSIPANLLGLTLRNVPQENVSFWLGVKYSWNPACRAYMTVTKMTFEIQAILFKIQGGLACNSIFNKLVTVWWLFVYGIEFWYCSNFFDIQYV